MNRSDQQLMRAAVVSAAGPAESFSIEEIPLPVVGNDSILIRQTLAAVNHGDVVRRKRGLFDPALPAPYVLGFEGVGTVAQVGQAVTDFQVGDRVAYLVEHGGYAEYVTAPSTKVWRVPQAVSDEQAAGATCAGLTAWGLIREAQAGGTQRVLVHGAAGGVGSLLVQLLGAGRSRVSCLVSGEGKARFVGGLADCEVYDRTNSSSLADIKSQEGCYDVIFDCVGADVVALNANLVASGGVWMYYGSTSGHSNFPGMTVLMKHVRLQGFVVFDYFGDTARWNQGTTAVGDALETGMLRVAIANVFPLAQVALAHKALEARQVEGKTLLAF